MLDVTAGNAGDKKAYLFIGNSRGSTRCEYKGGSPVPHPSRAADVAAGLVYRFERCTNGLTAGALTTADDIRLHVHEGDSKRGTTVVTYRLQESSPCVGASAQPRDLHAGKHCGHAIVACEADDSEEDGHEGRGR